MDDIGHNLSSIPLSSFVNNKNDGITMRSVSKGMQNDQLFNMTGFQVHDTGDYELECSSMDDNKESEVSYQTSKVELEMLHSNTGDGDVPRLKDFLKGMYYSGHAKDVPSFKTLQQLAEHIEPLYDSFFCPLTKKIMEDPVTIESGVTYERRAIEEWFDVFMNDSKDIACPVTKKRLQNRVLNTNFALQITIDEWKRRNEVTRMRLAQAALALASSAAMVLDAIKDLKDLGTKGNHNKLRMHNVRITEMLTGFLEHADRNVRCETLDILCFLAEDESGKGIISRARSIAAAVKMLSSSHHQERHASVSLLLELSKSDQLHEGIGASPGAISTLITMKYDESSEPVISEKAGEILQNLEQCPQNIKCMAENGLLDPLLNRLIDGNEEMQMEMVSYLGEIALGSYMKTYVAQRASQVLVEMVHNGNTLSRKAALTVLLHISSHYPNSEVLIDANVIPIMFEEIFTRKIHNEPMDTKEESSAVLANILEAGADPGLLQVNKHGHTMASDYVIYNFACVLGYSNSDDLNRNILRILLCLANLPKLYASVVTAVKDTEVCHTVIEFLNSSKDDLIIISGKLLMTLTPRMGHSIAGAICRTRGQPESIIRKLDGNWITKKHAISTNLLARLPHQNLTLNLALLDNATVRTIIERIQDFQRGEMSSGRNVRHYVEGLVGILVRFTSTLYDNDVLEMAREKDLATLFTDLLTNPAGSDEVKRMAAIGLGNLSKETINLSKPPPETATTPKCRTFLPKCCNIGARKVKKIKLCPVHMGECSLKTTFCLLECNAVERLVRCLENENVGVVEASLNAMCTLLDERVNVERSVEVLNAAGMVEQVVGVLREHKDERELCEKVFWVMERCLMMKGGEGEAIGSGIVGEREAYQHGDRGSRDCNSMPNLGGNFTS